MTKAKVLKFANALLFLSALAQAATGIILMFTFAEILGDFHQGNGIALIVLILAHVWLNWNWMKANYFKFGAKA